MNKPTPPKNFDSSKDISLYEIQIFLSQMMKYYAKEGYFFDKKENKSLYYFFDFQIGMKICEEKEYQKGLNDSYMIQVWYSLVYIWEKHYIRLDAFYKYLEANSNKESWYSQKDENKRKNKGALEHLIDFVGKEKALMFNQALCHIGTISNKVTGLQYNEDYAPHFGNSERQRTLNYIKYLQNYFKNMNDCYEEIYENTDFPTTKNWHIV